MSFGIFSCVCAWWTLLFPIFKRVAMSLLIHRQCQRIDERALLLANFFWWLNNGSFKMIFARELNDKGNQWEFYDLPVHLVIERTAPASEDARRDELTLHVVRQLPIQADQPQSQLNTLAGGAIIHDHQEKTVLLSLKLKIMLIRTTFFSFSHLNWIGIINFNEILIIFPP